MFKMIAVFSTLAGSVLLANSFAPVQSLEQIQSEVDFLSSTNTLGLSYEGTCGSLNNLVLPLSYFSTADYWAQYVGMLPGNDLTVVDVVNSDWSMTPDTNSPGANLQIERVNIYNGTDIYDAACWQIALGVCAKNGLKTSSGQDLFQIAENQNQLIYNGYDGNGLMVTANANRATTHQDGTFTYNGVKIDKPSQAYFFRMVTRNWLSTDPFLGTSYMSYITAENLPPGSSPYKAGEISWMDWKPITGENAWAFLTGPLQVAYLEQQAKGTQYVPFASLAVQNSLGVLYAFRCMQSEVGCLYYACQGSLGNQGGQPVNPHEVSTENNASTLAGLMILNQILNDELNHEQDLSAQQKQTIQEALESIKTLIYGGTTPQGNATKGILSYFQNAAWDASNGIFYQGGLANDPNQEQDWVPTVEPKAVDVNTWGLAALGQPLVDSWFGFGTAYKVWQNVKSWGAFYGPDMEIWGVGYSDQDGNGNQGNYQNGILSVEWTAGAINMARCLITQYQQASTNPKYTAQEQSQAIEYVEDLQKDHDSMYKNILSLRTDNYSTESAYQSVRPANYSSLMPIPDSTLGFMYASKRYPIPFGWFANPLPSTTSTSWMIMLHFNFNPFAIGGSYNPVEY
jgi:hypothetical protein